MGCEFGVVIVAVCCFELWGVRWLLVAELLFLGGLMPIWVLFGLVILLLLLLYVGVVRCFLVGFVFAVVYVFGMVVDYWCCLRELSGVVFMVFPGVMYLWWLLLVFIVWLWLLL